MSSKARNQLRIIGGKWRGRKVSFLAAEGVRPTPDRVRETLFNWLMHEVEGAHCLDCFAGSGALGLEALSRGAASVSFIDSNPKICAELTKQLANLAATNANIVTTELPKPIRINKQYNIVFLDPPYYKNLIGPCCRWLVESNLLAPEAVVYIEAEAKLKELPLPEQWQILKQKRAGQVAYYLIKTGTGYRHPCG